MTASLPARFGRFEVKELLGRGAMGSVYLAEDPVIGRSVAIKAVRGETGLHEDELAELRGRFEREFRSAGTLSHPNIVTVFDVGQEGEFSFIAMEHVRGESLEAVLRSERILTFKEISDLAFQMGGALDYAHERGIVHRDIKPANILMTGAGRAKLTDFGVARLTSSTMTRTGTIIGTPAYMSPEQITGHEVSGASDQFSLAVILYQLLTGERPFSAENPTTVLYKIVHEQPPRPQEINRELPPEIDQILLKALSKKPEERYGSCSELAEALREALGAAPVEPTLGLERAEITSLRQPAAKAAAQTGRTGGHPGIWAAAAAVALLAFGWFAWEMLSPKLRSSEGESAAGGQETAAQGAAGQLARSVRIDPGRPGLAVWLDGVDTGQRTPTSVELRGAAGESRRLELRDGEQVLAGGDLVLGPDLPPSWPPAEQAAQLAARTVRILSRPEGARVLLDGEPVGGTPAEVRLAPGQSRELRVELEDYKPVGLTLSLETLSEEQLARGELFFPLEQLVPPGQVRLAAAYPAAVTVRGRRYGPEAGLRLNLPPGKHRLEIAAPDVFLRLVREVEVTSGAEVSVNLPPLVKVSVTAVPGNCQVSIDERVVDFTPIRDLPVAAGSHRFLFEWPALGTSQARVEEISTANSRISARAPQ